MIRDEEYILIRMAQAGDQDAMLALLKQHERFIWKLAIHTTARGLTREDLLQLGKQHFIEAVHKFQFNRNCRLNTFAYRVVAQRVHQDAFFEGIVRFKSTSRTTAPEQVNKLWMIGAIGDSAAARCLDKCDVVEIASRSEQLERLRHAIHMLPDLEHGIITRRLAEETLDSIAASMNLSKERIRQIEMRARRMIKEDMERTTPRKRRRRQFNRSSSKRRKKAA